MRRSAALRQEDGARCRRRCRDWREIGPRTSRISAAARGRCRVAASRNAARANALCRLRSARPLRVASRTAPASQDPGTDPAPVSRVVSRGSPGGGVPLDRTDGSQETYACHLSGLPAQPAIRLQGIQGSATKPRTSRWVDHSHRSGSSQRRSLHGFSARYRACRERCFQSGTGTGGGGVSQVPGATELRARARRDGRSAGSRAPGTRRCTWVGISTALSASGNA